MKGRRRERGQYIETRLSVDRGGDWRSFTDTLPKSCAVIGTVTEDRETWRFEESNGNYNFYGYGTKSEAEQFKEELMKDDEPYHYYSIDLGTLPHESEQYEYLDLRDLKKGIEEFQTARMEAARETAFQEHIERTQDLKGLPFEHWDAGGFFDDMREDFYKRQGKTPPSPELAPRRL